MSDPNFWGFTRYEIELTHDTTEAHVLNFIISCINGNATQKICKRGNKYTAQLAYQSIANRFFWCTARQAKHAVRKLKAKGILQVLYNDYKEDRYRIYTLHDKIYAELSSQSYFIEGVGRIKKMGGTDKFVRGTDKFVRATDKFVCNNNSSNNLIRKEEEEESFVAEAPPSPLAVSQIALSKSDAIAIINHYNAIGIIKHALSAHLIKDVIDLLKKRPRPLKTHLEALDRFGLAYKNIRWTQKWTLPIFLKRASAVDHFYEENYIPEKWTIQTEDNLNLSQAATDFFLGKGE